jgi:hypothetical protein
VRTVGTGDNAFPVADLENPMANTTDTTLDPKDQEYLAGIARKRRRRRIALGILIVLLLLPAAVYVVMEWRSRDAFASFVAERKALGEPIEMQDFARPPIPDEENAAWYLKRAADAFRPTRRQEVLLGYAIDDPNLRDLSGEVAAFLDAADRPLKLMHQAAGADQADWQLEWERGNGMTMLLPSLAPMRNLAKLGVLAARHAHLKGNDRLALVRTNDVLALARAVDAEGVLICHLVTIACDSLVMGQLERLAPSLRVGDREGLAPRRQVNDLIDRLLATAGHRQALQRAIFGERAMLLDAARLILAGKRSLGSLTSGNRPGVAANVLTTVARPILRNDMIYALQMETQLAQAAGEATYPAFVASCPPSPDSMTELERAMHPFTVSMLPSLDRAVEIHYRQLAMQRMTAVRLAMRLAELDLGRPVTDLNELVPGYLSAIPADPFAQDAPLQLGRWGDKDVIYSVGPDGHDGGGQWAADPNLGREWDRYDLPLFLDGRDPVQQRAEEVRQLLAEDASAAPHPGDADPGLPQPGPAPSPER